jgi:hypothetical protein
VAETDRVTVTVAVVTVVVIVVVTVVVTAEMIADRPEMVENPVAENK